VIHVPSTSPRQISRHSAVEVDPSRREPSSNCTLHVNADPNSPAVTLMSTPIRVPRARRRAAAETGVQPPRVGAAYAQGGRIVDGASHRAQQRLFGLDG
jgi:hypothetical protein